MRFIMVTVLIDMIAIGLIIPVLPPLVGSFTDSASAQTYWYGALMIAFGVANLFAAPLLGSLSDRYGRRPVLLLGFAGLAFGFFATAWAPSLAVMLAVRLASGAMQANIAVANAYVADITPPAERARRFGLLGAMFGLGFVLGPVMGGLLGAIDLRLPFYVAGALALMNLAYGWFVLPESLPVSQRRGFRWSAANPFAALRDLAQLRGVGRLVGVLGLSGLAMLTLQTSWVLYTGFKFGWGPLQNGWSLFAVGLMSALVQGVLLSRLLKRLSAPRLALAGLVSSTLCYVAWGAATEGWMMFAIIGANLLGFAVTPAMQSIVSGAADARTQGRTMGAVAGINSLTAVLGPIVGTALLGSVSHLPRGDWRLGLPMFFCAALQALSLTLAWSHFRARRQASAGVAPPATSG